MEFDGWEGLFDEIILKKGKDYFDSGCVEHLSVKQREADADVWGTHLYHVRIKWNNRKITAMQCDCPYDDDCKHMVAVLYALQSVKEPQNKKAEISLEKLVASADAKAVKKFLLEVLKDDEELALRFKNSLAPQEKKIDITPYVNRAKKIAQISARDYGWLDTGYFYEHVKEIDRIFANDLPFLLERKQFMPASELVTKVFDAFTGINDEEGDLYVLANACSDQIKKILESNDEESAEFLFDWCVENIEGDLESNSTPMYEAVYDLFHECFEEGAIAERKLEYIKSMAERNPSFWMCTYLDALLGRGTPWEEIAAFCKKRLQTPNVLDWYKNHCIQRGEIEEAIRILEHGCAFAAKDSWKQLGYRQELKDLYAQKGDKEKELEMLWWLVEENLHKTSRLYLLNELRPFYDAEDWKQKREKVFASALSFEMCELLQAEKLTDRLLPEVLKLRAVGDIVKYAGDLEDNAQSLLDRCEQILQGNMRMANSRNAYMYCVDDLMLLKKIKGGSKLITKLVSEWTVTYKRRSAMLEVLRKAM